MKLALLFALGVTLGLTSSSLLLDAGLKQGLVIPSRSLADASPEEQKIIDFVLEKFDELISVQQKPTGTPDKPVRIFFNNKDNKAPDSLGKMPPHKFEEANHLGTWYFKLDKDNSPEAGREILTDTILFWVHVGRTVKGPAAKATDANPAKAVSKKSTKDLSFEFTNGIVTSKVKVQYGFGGMELLKNFIVRSCFNYLMKVEQSVTSLVTIEPMVTLFAGHLDTIFAANVNNGKMDYTLKYVLAAKKLTQDYKNGGAAVDAKGLPANIKALIVETEKAMGGESALNEHLVYTISPVIDQEKAGNLPDYATYIDTFHLIIVKANGRAMIMVHSRHFSDSVEVSVNSKTTVLETVFNLVRKVITETWQNFMELDPSPTECPNGLVYASKKLAKLGFGDGSAGKAEEEVKQGGSTVYQKDMGANYKLIVSLSSLESADIKVEIKLMNGDTEQPRIFQQSYFPLTSQYCSGVFVTAYVQKMSEDFANIAYSELIRKPAVGPEAEKEKQEVRKHLGNKYSAPFLGDLPHNDKDRFVSYLFRAQQKEILDCQATEPKKEDAARNWEAIICKKTMSVGGVEAVVVCVEFKAIP